MAIRFHVDIVSAESSIYSGQADQLMVPTQMGELGIHARHAPLFAVLKPGLVRTLLDGIERHVDFVSSGFLEVQPHIVTILADTVIRSGEFDEAAARAARYLAKEGEVIHKRSIDSELALQIALLRALDEAKNTHNSQRKWPNEQNPSD